MKTAHYNLMINMFVLLQLVAIILLSADRGFEATIYVVSNIWIAITEIRRIYDNKSHENKN